MRGLARRGMAQRRLRSALTAIAVLLGVSMISGTYVLTDQIHDSFEDILRTNVTGVFFTVPLFLSVVLELSALQTGARLLPLSLALLATAVGIPKLVPRARPRLVVRLGLLSLTVGTLVFIGGLSPGADAGIVVVPMLLLGLGIGALASQLGAITVSAVPAATVSR